MHLCRGALEEPAATARKQRVAAKQDRRGVTVGVEERDVPARVPGHVDHLKLQTEHIDARTFVQGDVGGGDRLTARPIDRAAQQRTQRRHASDMVAMVVGH